MSRIAVEAQVPRKFLEIILTYPKGAGIVVSTRDKQGGFHSARPAHLISFGNIIRVIEWRSLADAVAEELVAAE
jgi:DNA-binding IscR family transcriptional regulator